VESGQARKRLGEARVARLATADAGGVPHVVPFVFVLDGDTIYWAVDEKPKRTRDLKRLANIRANPNVDVVVDHYDEDWRTLWWVRASGPARVVDDDDEAYRALALLAEKYPQYRASAPQGPVVAVEIAHLRWWSTSPEE
jgi:PPOX class probable F420-dependent enzyme